MNTKTLQFINPVSWNYEENHGELMNRKTLKITLSGAQYQDFLLHNNLKEK